MIGPLENHLKAKICNMDTEIRRTSHLKSEEDPNISHKQNVQAHCLYNSSYLNGCQETFAPERVGYTLCHEDNCESQGSRGDAAEDANVGTEPDTVSKKLRQQTEMTFQDIYKEEYDDIDDEDEDSDWEPSQDNTKKWFCTNCTMVNLDDVLHCDICGEFKDSEILKL